MSHQRYFISIMYDGTRYHGWQRQPKAVSIQEEIEKRMSLLLDQPVELTTAGRTDAGVHALQTYAHFDVPSALDPEWLTRRMNAFLPRDIAFRYTVPVPPDAHARYDARSRYYTYHLITRKNPFREAYAWRLNEIPDIRRMNEAARILLDYEDFESFSKVKTDVKHFRCRITEAYWEQAAPDHMIFHIRANRFLRNMVRAIVGTLVETGLGKREPEDMHRILQARDRRMAGASAPGRGLFLTEVTYKESIQDILNRQ